MSNISTICITVESNFNNNHANEPGGAVYVGTGCSMSWAGEISFSGNIASRSDHPRATHHGRGGISFTGNTATANGDAMMASKGGGISWSE